VKTRGIISTSFLSYGGQKKETGEERLWNRHAKRSSCNLMSRKNIFDLGERTENESTGFYGNG